MEGGRGNLHHDSLKAQLFLKMHLDATLKYLCKFSLPYFETQNLLFQVGFL